MYIKGENEILIKDVLVGDVWLCIGQSNMEQSMSGRLKYRYAQEIAHDSFPFIRHFLVPDNYAFDRPWNDFPTGNWVSATPSHLQEFTAVGYSFAKSLYQQYNVPVGIINAAMGGTPAEAWISENALQSFPNAWNELQQFKNASYVSGLEQKEQLALRQWNEALTQADEGLKNNWQHAAINHEWNTVIVPGYWHEIMPGKLPGVVWCKKEIEVPASMMAQPSKLELGRMIDADSVFVNGLFVGNTTYQYPARRYELPANVLRIGRNEITIRVHCNGKLGGFVPDKVYQLTTAYDTIELNGEWKYRIGATASQPAPPVTQVRWKPGGLYNAMIAPLQRYGLKGVVWYQGESNASAFEQYGLLMKALIHDWRNTFNHNRLPFLIVQLPNFMEAADTVQLRSEWAGLRQQQLNLRSIAQTAMVVTIDLGEWNDIHPENKADVGIRLALQARKNFYQEKHLVATGPLIQKAIRKKKNIRLQFESTGSGLLFNGNDSPHFFVQSKSGTITKATASIVGRKVVLTGVDVNNAQKVFYAYADNPTGAVLYNKEGLPASPFQIELQ
ncbi:sialate O-acetylesterase [Phnomibacter sp.]|uniref:sialate O-acetylesterase n=1 Tax=Phnomibacter sp. TaxID=2836217 RepID=UPI002FDE4E75